MSRPHSPPVSSPALPRREWLHQATPFTAHLWQHMPLLAPVLAILALAASILAGSAIKQAIALWRETAAPPHLFKVIKVPATASDYVTWQPAISRLNSPGLQIAVGSDKQSLVIASASADQIPEWSYAVSTLPAVTGKWLWQANLLCIGKCEGGAAVAHLQAFRQEIKEQP